MPGKPRRRAPSPLIRKIATRNDGARRLRRRFDGAPDKNLDPSKYMHLVRTAMNNAVALAERHSRDGTRFPQDNPSSGMYLLIASTGAEWDC